MLDLARGPVLVAQSHGRLGGYQAVLLSIYGGEFAADLRCRDSFSFLPVLTDMHVNMAVTGPRTRTTVSYSVCFPSYTNYRICSTRRSTLFGVVLRAGHE